MTKIYEQHDKAFTSVSAYVLVSNGEMVGTIAFKFPKDGAGRLSVYFHILGIEMVKGNASGYGYDKRSAAMVDAARKISGITDEQILDRGEDWVVKTNKIVGAVQKALATDGGHYWDRKLIDAGFAVWQAV